VRDSNGRLKVLARERIERVAPAFVLNLKNWQLFTMHGNLLGGWWRNGAGSVTSPICIGDGVRHRRMCCCKSSLVMVARRGDWK